MYFSLSCVIDKFPSLHYALSAILMYIGFKLIASASGIHLPNSLSLIIIFISVTIAVLFDWKKLNNTNS